MGRQTYPIIVFRHGILVRIGQYFAFEIKLFLSLYFIYILKCLKYGNKMHIYFMIYSKCFFIILIYKLYKL